MSFEHIKELVKNHKIPRVIGLFGAEQLLIEEALALLRTTLLEDADLSLNYHRYDAAEKLPTEWFSSLKTPPFLARERVVEIHNAEKLSTHDQALVVDYVTNICDFSVLILLFSKTDKRNKLISILDNNKLLFEFEKLNNDQIANYVLSYIKNNNIKINNEALNFLNMILDYDLIAIKEALKKLSIVDVPKELTLEEVAVHIGTEQYADIFKLARSLSEGDLKKSLYLLGLLRKNQENALQLMGVLMWQFRVLLHIRSCLDKGMAQWDIRKEVSVYGERFTWMLNIAQKRTIAFHAHRLTRLLQCDMALKSQKIAEPLSFIERVVYQSVIGI